MTPNQKDIMNKAVEDAMSGKPINLNELRDKLKQNTPKKKPNYLFSTQVEELTHALEELQKLEIMRKFKDLS